MIYNSVKNIEKSNPEKGGQEKQDPEKRNPGSKNINCTVIYELLSIACIVFLVAFIPCKAMAIEYYDDFIDDVVTTDYAEQTWNSHKRYRFKISYDNNFSSIASADLFNSGYDIYRVVDEKYMHTHSSFLIRGFSYLTKLWFSQFFVTAQHEIGGHGGRLRELDVFVKSYKVNFDGSGSTSFSSKDFNKLSPYEKSAVSIGGVESTYVMSQKISARFFEEGKIHPSLSILYISAMSDQPNYIFNTKRKGNSSGHDIQAYIDNLNFMYGQNHIDRSKIRSYAYFDLIDPLFWFSAYSFITARSIDVPMIDLGSFEYLPSLRSTLAPYGPEHNLVNHIRYDGKYIRIMLGYGEHKKTNSYNFNIMGTNLYHFKNLSCGGEIAIWRQPKLFGKNPAKDNLEFGTKFGAKFGVMGEITAALQLLDNLNLHLAGGIKTRGFVLGRPLQNSAMVSVGTEIGF